MARARVGSDVVRILEEAAEHYLAGTAPDAHRVFMLQVSGARIGDPVADQTFWRWVQAMLDYFFSADERTEIAARLMACPELQSGPEACQFCATALAERRLQLLLASIHIDCAAPVR